MSARWAFTLPRPFALALWVGCTEAPRPSPPASLPDLVADPRENLGCDSETPAHGTAVATHVRCQQQLPRGPLSMGALGDILLWNDRARFILRSGDSSATTLGAPGGGVIDATARGDDTDGLKEALPVLNLHGLFVGPFTVVQSLGARVVVRAAFIPRPLELVQSVIPSLGQRPELHGVIEYSLSGDDTALHVRVCALPDPGRDLVSAKPGMVLLLGGASEVMAPGAGVLEGQMASAVATSLLAESPTTAYGASLEGASATILHVGTVSLLESVARVPFTQTALRCASMRFAVAPTEAEITDALAPSSLPMLEVNVPPGGRAELRDPEGRVLLRSRGLEGRVRARLPAELANTRISREFGTFGPANAIPPTGLLHVRTSVTQEPGAPVRITVRGAEGGLDARFVSTGDARFTLPAGRYQVSASRGGEYTVSTAEVSVGDAEAEFTASLARVVDTSGEVATDFHLHTELSTDSVHPVTDAVRQMAAEGLEAVAATDHDFISDHAPVIEASDVRGWILAVPGEEVSTTRLGHYGGYPLRRDTTRSGAGAVSWFGLSPGDIFSALRSRGDEVVVQVNHPRLRGSGVFDQIGLDPVSAVARADPSALGLDPGADLNDLSFDVLEVWNGYTRGGNERTFTDWLSLRAAGRRYVMVANSDSHRPDKPPGAPRSYVRVPDDRRGSFAWRDVNSSLRAGDVRVSAGIYVQATIGDSRPGGVARATDGSVTLHIRVQAPPWVDCTRLRVYRGTETVIDQRVDTPRSRVLRFDGDLRVSVSSPSFVVVRADGESDAEPVFSFAPFGLTNPIDVSP